MKRDNVSLVIIDAEGKSKVNSKSLPSTAAHHSTVGFPYHSVGKEPAYQSRRHKRLGSEPWVGKISWRRAWPPTPVFLPGEPHGQGAWQAAVHGSRRVDTTDQAHSSVCVNPDLIYPSLLFPFGNHKFVFWSVSLFPFCK